MENFHEIYKEAKPWDQKRRRAEVAYEELVEAQQATQDALQDTADKFNQLKPIFV